MKKNTKKMSEKTQPELLKEAQQLRKEIVKIGLESRLGPQKDTNLVMKKRKQLAVVLTVFNSSRRKAGIPTPKQSEKK